MRRVKEIESEIIVWKERSLAGDSKPSKLEHATMNYTSSTRIL